MPKNKLETSQDSEKVKGFLEIGEKILVGLVLPLMIFGAKMYADAQVTKEKLVVVKAQLKETEGKLEKKFEGVFIRLEQRVKEIAGEVNKDAQTLILVRERMRSLHQNLDEIKDILRGHRRKGGKER